MPMIFFHVVDVCRWPMWYLSFRVLVFDGPFLFFPGQKTFSMAQWVFFRLEQYCQSQRHANVVLKPG